MIPSQDSEVWSISVNNFEWHIARGAGNSKVKYKFSKGEPFYPVILVLRDKESKEFFYFLILSFDFAIAFRVIGGGESGFNAEVLIESSHVPGSKL